jgi:hypothetical protein
VGFVGPAGPLFPYAKRLAILLSGPCGRAAAGNLSRGQRLIALMPDQLSRLVPPPVTKRLALLLAIALIAQPAEARHRHHAASPPATDATQPPAPAASDAPPVPAPRPAPDEEGATPPAAAAPAATEARPEGPPTVESGDARIYQTACPAIVAGTVQAKLEAPIDTGICGAHSPYAVTAVTAGDATVKVEGDVVVNCQMATALGRWLGQIAPAAAVIIKSPLTAVRVGTSYQCRRRYGATDGPISEHAFADAVDLTTFSFADGTDVTVDADWTGDGPKTQFLHFAHDAACGDFTTVLGPEANVAHKSHFHLDLSCHGKTCTYRICE